jgi:segregation and condensation protein B
MEPAPAAPAETTPDVEVIDSAPEAIGETPATTGAPAGPETTAEMEASAAEEPPAAIDAPVVDETPTAAEPTPADESTESAEPAATEESRETAEVTETNAVAETDDSAAVADTSDGDESTEPTLVEEPPSEVTTEQIVEAILFSADTPLSPARIVDIIGTGSARDVRKHIETLNQRYQQTGATFRIEKMAGGYQMLTIPTFNAWLKRLKQARQETKLSQAAMETLAVVAYKQPVVRAEIEAIRGVATGEMLNRLRELGLVKIVGRAEDVGHPLLYGTTKRFLDVFGLGSLEDLPTVEELKAPG